jgi:hypothetical protein
MSIKAWKGAAVACLVLAIAAIAMALMASQDRVRIQGPSALAALPDGRVWLGVDDALWRFDANGRREAVLPARALGLPGVPSNIVPHPDGRLAVSVRDDEVLYFLDAQTGRVVSRVLPRWPDDLRRHAARAIHFAIHPDGRIAIATGGGHAVAMFAADGGYLGRTRPGLYEFTNGLWWSGDRLWTTDTNRFALVALDGRSLQEQERLKLKGPLARCRFLGMVAPPAEGMGALTTLVRFDNGMVRGELADVQADGEPRPYPSRAILEPRDIKRLGADLLLVDGASYAVKRYSAARNELGDFGDAASRDALASLQRTRAALHQRYQLGLGAGVVLFVLGLVLALRAQQMEKNEKLRTFAVDLSQLGADRLDAAARVRVMVALTWPLLLAAAGLATLHVAVRAGWIRGSAMTTVLVVMAASLLLLLVAVGVVFRQLRRARSDRVVDAYFNQGAVLALESRETFWKLRLPGEVPRETLTLMAGMRGRQWLVLTNQRLLVFTSNLTDHVLRAQHGRRDIAGAGLVPRAERTLLQKLQGLLGAVVLRIRLRDGGTVEGSTWSPLTAMRLIQLLGSEAPAAGAGHVATAAISRLAPGQVPDEGPAWRQTLASLLVPGTGQWMQGRSATGFILFVAWAVLLVLSALPVFWTWWAPRAAVPTSMLAMVGTAYVLTCLSAAFDAWRMRER